MLTNRKYLKKIKPLILILLFLIPLNALFLNVNDTSVINESVINLDKTRDEDLENPKISAITLDTLRINDTTIYRNGTFYMFQNDTLFFEFTNNSQVSSAQILIPGLPTVTPIVLSYYLGSNSYNATQAFNVATGEYDCELVYINSSKTVRMNFKLNIADPSIQATKLWVRNTIFDNTWREVKEGGIFSTYRGTTLEFTLETINRDSITDAVQLDYNDGIRITSEGLTPQGPIGNTRNFTLVGAANDIDVIVNTTADGKNQWKPSKDLYSFMFNASKTGSNDYYLFECFLEIKNKAPQITKFDVTPGYLSAGSITGPVTVSVKANASDLEDDQLYWGGAIREANYTDPVIGIKNTSGCVINDPVPGDLDYLKTGDGSQVYDMTFQASQSGTFLINLSMNTEINISNMKSFQTSFRIYDSYGSTATTGKMEIWNSNTGSWENLANLNYLGGSFVYINNDSSQLTETDLSYYISQNYTVQLRLSWNEGSNVNAYLDYVAITTTVERRETFTRAVLQIWSPTKVLSAIEILNHWDDANGIWDYDFTIDNYTTNYGSWTFNLHLLDHGDHDYINNIWGNYSLGSSSSSDSYGFKYSTTTNAGYGQVLATRIISIGLPQQEALNISSNPQFNATVNILHDDTVNISLLVDGIDTQNLIYKDYVNRKDPEGNRLYLQKNATATNSSGTQGDATYPTYEIDGSIKNITEDDDTSYDIKMGKDLVSNWAHHTLMWNVILNQRSDVSKENITAIYIDIDNWLNTTTADLSDVFFEFWNVTSSSWATPSSGFWSGATNLFTTVHDQHFIRTLTDPNDLLNFIDGSKRVRMRLRIVTSQPALDEDYELSIDFINITAKVRYFYDAKLKLLSNINSATKEIQLTPYAKGAWTMQYSCIINIQDAGLFADIFRLQFEFCNGNSSIAFLSYRREPSVIIDRTSKTNKFVSYYYFNPAEEILTIDKNYTLRVYDYPILFTTEMLFENINSQTGTSSSILFTRGITTVNYTSIINFGTLEFNNPNLYPFIQIKQGNKQLFSGWYTSIANQYGDGSRLALNKGILTGDDLGTYYIRIYLRTPFGEELATAWKEYRVQNFQPIDFDFDFLTGTPIERTRDSTYTFDFSFIDYDMTNTWASTHVDKINTKFLLNDKGTGDTWLEPETLTWFDDLTSYKQSYHVTMRIPTTTTTGAWNASYYNWQFIVNDTADSTQNQLSHIYYNQTEFIIENNEPLIVGLTTNISANVLRNNDIEVTFNITDVDDPDPLSLSVMYLNITGPQGAVNISVGNSSVPYSNGLRRYKGYTVPRNATLGTYVVSIKINDSDGRVVLDVSNSFEVINNRPVIKAVNYTNYVAGGIYRNIDTFIIPEVIFKVNISDVEDSWLGDNETKDKNGNVPYILLRHDPVYTATIAQLSPSLEPIRLNLTLKYAGNNSNGHVETWTTSIQFNDTINTEKFYAGKIIVEIYVNDSDGGTNFTTSAEGKIANFDDLIIKNYAPTLTSRLVTSIGMTVAKQYYIPASVAKGGTIKIYIFAHDDEELAQIKIWYYTISAGDLYEKYETMEFTSANWNHTTINSFEVFICEFNSSILADTILKIKIDEIAVYDSDFGYKPLSDYGATYANIKTVNHEVSFTTPYVTPPVINVIVIFMVVASIFIVAVIGIGIFLWRKKSGWRKFMD